MSRTNSGSRLLNVELHQGPIHEFNLYFSLLRNHEKAYENQELFYYLEP